MRPSSSLLLPVVCAALLSSACSSGTVGVYQTPRPAPAPVRRITPLEITVVRSETGRLLLQTNRAAYVALFEIVPGRGTALIYPQSIRQRGTTLGGLTWVSVWWAVPPAANRRLSVDDGRPERYVYALASDRPLRVSDYAYDADYLQRVLGAEAYRGSNPYATVRALSRQFVPVMPDEQWGEDLYALAAPAARVTYRIARVYCADGTVFEVREDMAHRAWCPSRRGRGTVVGAPTGGADAPDSVVSPGGRAVARRPFDPSDRQPPFRVPAPNVSQPPTPTQVDEGRDRDDKNKDKNKDQDKDKNKDQDKDKPQGNDRDKDKDHDDNGRRSHGDPRNADPRGRGNGSGSGNQPRTEPQPLPELKLQGEPTPPANANPPEKAKPDKEEKVQRVEKPDQSPPRPEPTPEPKPEPRAEQKPEPKVESKPEPKPEPKAEPKSESKPPSSIETLIKKRGPKDKKNEPARPDSTGGRP